MPDNGQNVNRRIQKLLSNGWRMWGSLCRYELKNSVGLWVLVLHQSLNKKNWIYHSTGFLNYTSVLSSSAILLGLPNAPQNLSKLLTCILSAVKTGLQSYCDTSYSRGGVNQMWVLKNSRSVKSTYNLGPSPAISLKHLTSLHNYSSLYAEEQIKRVGPTVFHKKRMANVVTNTLC